GIICLFTAAALHGAGGEHWVATWGTAQQLYRAAGGRGQAAPAPAAGPVPAPAPAKGPARRFPVPPALASVNNQTIRMVARTSIGGHRVRIRLENALGAGSVTF